LRVAIVGSRHFSDLSRVGEYVKSLPPRASIVTGSASGVDASATKAAREKGIPVQVMPASFDEMADASKSAARNQRLVDSCDVLVAFWDGSSKGTRTTVERALDSGKEVHVFVMRGNLPVPSPIAVRVRLFARLREQAGLETEALEVAPGSTLADVYESLRRKHSALEPDRDSVRGAINQEFSDWSATVSQGDEVAFIPPVSGGC